MITFSFVKKSNLWVSYSFSFSFIFILFLISLYYFQYGDDFVFLLGIEKYGVFGNLWFKFMHWDGRHLSIAGLVQSLYFKFFSPTLSLWIGIFSFYLSFLLVIFSFDFELDIKSKFIIFVLFLIGFLPFYKDVVLWQTGVVYSIFLLQTCFSLYIYLKKDFHPLLLFFVILILSVNSQNLNFAFGFFVFFNGVWKYKKSPIDKEIVCIFSIILSVLIVSLAPGNSQRMIFIGFFSDEDLSFFTQIYNIVFKSLTYSKYSFLLGFLSVLLVSKKKPSILNFLLFVLMGFSSIIPFFLIPQVFSVRVIFVVSFFWFFAGLELASVIKENFNLNNNIFYFLMNISLLSGNVILLNQFVDYKKLSDKIILRDKYLKSKSNSGIVMYPYINLPPGLFITRSPSYEDLWRNEFLEYYKIKDFVQY
ncbi:MAG: DUF6056 family protein [Algoriphagus aquaeductus]|uniref:DUF6056 family protein n=1 Tax=Algoriphagus aquaeductus TaxID=475299 RepID=UPI00387A7E0A